MKFLLNILILIMKFIYFFFKLFSTKNKITMISRQSNDVPINYQLLASEIKKRKSYEFVILAKKMEPGIINKIKYIFHVFSQMYHIATSKVVILDSYCITISLLKHKKDLIVIQMWHAMGSLKKFGKSVLDTDANNSSINKKISIEEKKQLSDIMNMHKGYDYIFVSSEFCVPNFAEAFGYSKDCLVVMPLPLVDQLNDINYSKTIINKIKEKYKNIELKKNILYVPTFRNHENIKKIKELIDSINYDKYNLIIKLHPLSNIKIDDDRPIWDESFSSHDMLAIADYVITDYSAIVFDAAILLKPIFFYTYDYDDYITQRNFYIDFKKEMPGIITNNAYEIVENIKENNYDSEKISRFSSKFVNQTNQNVCERILNFIDIKVNEKAK